MGVEQGRPFDGANTEPWVHGSIKESGAARFVFIDDVKKNVFGARIYGDDGRFFNTGAGSSGPWVIAAMDVAYTVVFSMENRPDSTTCAQLSVRANRFLYVVL
jgi:hypothetical protein